jgi:CTP:molybdopterin cytidylyltransferase MocA
MGVTGLLLAAGTGRRMGVPKALLSDRGGVPFLDRAIGAILDGGCATVTVVLGAGASEAEDILRQHGWTADPDVSTVTAHDWAEGMGASLRAGLAVLPEAESAVVMLVDLPDVGADVVARMVRLSAPTALLRATYGGRPGHPVLIGRDHWSPVYETVRGDRGARDYLDAHGVRDVPCDDLATGRDLDRPEDLDPPTSLTT